jgi:hypothetical protein
MLLLELLGPVVPVQVRGANRSLQVAGTESRTGNYNPCVQRFGGRIVAGSFVKASSRPSRRQRALDRCIAQRYNRLTGNNSTSVAAKFRNIILTVCQVSTERSRYSTDNFAFQVYF